MPAKPKSVPERIPCPCGGKLAITYARTCFDGRVCEKCDKAVLTCHWCHGIVCEWTQGPSLSEYEYIPHSCPNCGSLMYMRDYAGPPRFDVQYFMPAAKKWASARGSDELDRDAAHALFEELVSEPGHPALRIRAVEMGIVVLQEAADDEGSEEGA